MFRTLGMITASESIHTSLPIIVSPASAKVGTSCIQKKGNVLIQSARCPWLSANMKATPDPMEQKLPMRRRSAPSSGSR